MRTIASVRARRTWTRSSGGPLLTRLALAALIVAAGCGGDAGADVDDDVPVGSAGAGGGAGASGASAGAAGSGAAGSAGSNAGAGGAGSNAGAGGAGSNAGASGGGGSSAGGAGSGSNAGAAGTSGKAGGAGTGGGCPALEPVDDSPLPVESSANKTESVSAGGFDDDYVYNQAGDRKLGIRRNWGGAIVFFGKHTGQVGQNVTNVIDGADTGREVQIALYDRPARTLQGCAYNSSCEKGPKPCPETMVFMGWNPVQGGNRCNSGSGYSDIAKADGAISLVSQMLQWNANWDRPDCQESCKSPATDKRLADVELTQRVRFVRPNVVELRYTVHNLANMAHDATVHEFPTLYAAFGRDGTPDLVRLFDSSAKEVTTGWQTDANGFRWQNFSSPAGWASLQNAAADYGVALQYESGMSQFQAWDKLEKPTKFNNFRGLYSFPIGASASVSARSYLILGGIAEVAAETKWLDGHLPPFGSLDGPVADAKVSGVISVGGWAMDNKSVSSVQMSVDGGAPVPLSYGADRPDVCALWPGYPACEKSKVGFQGMLDVSALSPGGCGHVIEIKAIDGDGNAKVIARRRIFKS